MIPVFLFCPLVSAKADDAEWRISAGAKSLAFEGTEPYFELRPYMKAARNSDVIDLSAGASHFFNHQITDNIGHYAYIGVNQLACNAGFGIKQFEFTLAAEGAMGESDFRAWELSFEPSFEQDPFTLTAGISLGIERFQMNSLDIKNRILDIFLEADYLYSDKASFDLTLSHTGYSMDAAGDESKKNTLRAGGIFLVKTGLSASAGLSAGLGSNSSKIAGFDLGLTYLFMDHVKLRGLYLFSHTFEESQAAGKGGGPSPVKQGIGQEETTHKIIFDASYIFFI